MRIPAADEPERVWQDFDAAIEELLREGWQITEGPGPIRPSIAGLGRFDLWGCMLRRSVPIRFPVAQSPLLVTWTVRENVAARSRRRGRGRHSLVAPIMQLRKMRTSKYST